MSSLVVVWHWHSYLDFCCWYFRLLCSFLEPVLRKSARHWMGRSTHWLPRWLMVRNTPTNQTYDTCIQVPSTMHTWQHKVEASPCPLTLFCGVCGLFSPHLHWAKWRLWKGGKCKLHYFFDHYSLGEREVFCTLITVVIKMRTMPWFSTLCGALLLTGMLTSHSPSLW